MFSSTKVTASVFRHLLSPRRRSTTTQRFVALVQFMLDQRSWQAGAHVGFRVCQNMWVVVKNMVPFWVLIIIRHLIFRLPKKGP